MISPNHAGQAQLPPALLGIPPFPAVAIQVLRVASNEYARLRELSNLIRADVAFSSEILRTANSSLYGLRTEVESILQATLLLGLERVKAIVVTAAMKNYVGALLHAPWMRACWRHSLACAVIAEHIADGTLEEPDVAYTAALIHDIGRLALAVAYADRYGVFLTNADDTVENSLAEERRLFGVDHCEAGRSLASWWGLPGSLSGVMAHHHDPQVGNDLDVLSIVRLSCLAADTLGFEAIRQHPAQTYAQLIETLPDRHRSRLPGDPSDLQLRIAAAINSIEVG